MEHCYFVSPIGVLELCAWEGALTAVRLQQGDAAPTPPHSALLQTACAQLTEYFAGQRQAFTLPLQATGTPFQQQVWQELRRIPYGETRSYADIATAIGNAKAVRAVGQANNKNPLLIVVPCHRVIHKNGDIAGFGAGIAAKQALLDLEKAHR